MNLETIKEKVLKILESYNLRLYSLVIKKDYGVDNIIEIIYKGETTNELHEEVHYKILDEIDPEMSDDAYLEVSRLGLEYPLQSLEEIKEHIGKYIYIACDYYKGYADLECVDSENNIIIKVKEKTKSKEIKIPYKENLKIRTAVKV